MSKVILICISGTGQETSDAKDNAIDNPLKIAVRGGWKGYGKPSDVEGQHVIYVPGIGTLESQKHIEGDRGGRAKIDAAGNAALAPQETVDARRAYILEQLENAGYEQGDTLCIAGFSRGAAEARQLAASLTQDSIPVRLLCCFDTVAQIGGPDKSQWPDDGLLFEDNAVAQSVEQAIHFVSIDENRLTFPPTLMDHDDRVREIWFAGVHSDVGGGYPEHQLSDVTLADMVEQMRAAGIVVREPGDIDERSLPRGIGAEDIACDPDPLAEMHHHKVAGKGVRIICVIEGGRPSRITPWVSDTVRERMGADPSYDIGNMFDWQFV
jgi:uncharacterized protein (DUF2235 family)